MVSAKGQRLWCQYRCLMLLLGLHFVMELFNFTDCFRSWYILVIFLIYPIFPASVSFYSHGDESSEHKVMSRLDGLCHAFCYLCCTLFRCSPELSCQSSQIVMSEDSKQIPCLGAAHFEFLSLGNWGLEVCTVFLWFVVGFNFQFTEIQLFPTKTFWGTIHETQQGEGTQHWKQQYIKLGLQVGIQIFSS